MTEPDALSLHAQLHGKIHVAANAELTEDNLTKFYTPGVAEVSKILADHPERWAELTVSGQTVAVISDGSAVLGLGNVGPVAAIPVMEGKAMLFRALGGVNAWPIVLSTQDPDEIVAAITAIAPSFAGINLEDIAAPACFEIEQRLQKELSIPVIHDDQHATAIVVLAGLYNATKLTSRVLADARVVVNGAGAAGSGIVRLLNAAGVKSVTLVDSRGVVSLDREDLTKEKLALAKLTGVETGGTFSDAVKGADILIGVSVAGAFHSDDIKNMAAQPIVFALANPEPEILPEQALEAGAAIVATGRSDFPNQINNVLVFPGLFRGLFEAKTSRLTDAHKLAAAQALAEIIEDPTSESIIPSVFDSAVVPAMIRAIGDATIQVEE